MYDDRTQRCAQKHCDDRLNPSRQSRVVDRHSRGCHRLAITFLAQHKETLAAAGILLARATRAPFTARRGPVAVTRAERATLISACARQPRGRDQNENEKDSKMWAYGFGHWTWLHDDDCFRDGNAGSIFIGEMFFDEI
jgi:hypothetical protein